MTHTNRIESYKANLTALRDRIRMLETDEAVCGLSKDEREILSGHRVSVEGLESALAELRAS